MKWILWIRRGLIGVIALACVVLLVLGHRAIARRTIVSADINASPAQFWQWIAILPHIRRAAPLGACGKATPCVVMKSPT
jgi:hypothetical protein